MPNDCEEVKTDAQPVACSMLEGGPCSPCKKRETIRQKIEQLEAEIAKLRVEHDALATPMNAIHDPFILKLPPEIGSHIFFLSLPTFDIERPFLEAQESLAAVLRLGAVCRKWRELASTTPHLWEILYISLRRSTSIFLAESLPGLLRKWLRRSGMLPLTILFSYSDEVDSDDDSSDDDSRPTTSIDKLKDTTTLAIEILNLHSGRWRNLYINTNDPDFFWHFSGSVQPTQLVDLCLNIDNSAVQKWSTPQFMMKSDPHPTHLKLNSIPLTSVSIGWEKLTHATLFHADFKEGVDLLRRAPSLEYYDVCIYVELEDVLGFSFETPILHPRLHSLHLSSCDIHTFLEAVNLPSLEELTLDLCGKPLPPATALSFLERSRCCLKVLNLEDIPGHRLDLDALLQAIPSLERLRLSFRYGHIDNSVLDDILTRIFCSATASSNISVTDSTTESFLPVLQVMEFRFAELAAAGFSWDLLPQLYRQGHRQSLTFKSGVLKAHMKYETACQLLQLVDEGSDLQIVDKTRGGDFLENFRNTMHERSL